MPVLQSNNSFTHQPPPLNFNNAPSPSPSPSMSPSPSNQQTNTITSVPHSPPVHFENPPSIHKNSDTQSSSTSQKAKKKKDEDKIWSHSETERLIELWHSNEELYRVDHQSYLDRGKRNLIISNMAAELETTAQEVQKKM